MPRKIIILFPALLLVVFFSCVAVHASELKLPGSLEEIEKEAFAGDESLDEVVLPKGLKKIQSLAFADSSVKKINLPNSLTYIADDAFNGVENLTVTAQEGTYAYEWADAKGYIKHTVPVTYYFNGGEISEEVNGKYVLYQKGSITYNPEIGSAYTIGVTGPLHRDGYTLAGWNTNRDGTGDFYNDSETVSVTEDMETLELYAQWDRTTYQVTFNANGGTGAPSPQTKLSFSRLVLSDIKPTRTGYVFRNWNTKADGSGTAYAAGAWYTADDSLTLYAQWDDLEDHEIRFDYTVQNGGETINVVDMLRDLSITEIIQQMETTNADVAYIKSKTEIATYFVGDATVTILTQSYQVNVNIRVMTAYIAELRSTTGSNGAFGEEGCIWEVVETEEEAKANILALVNEKRAEWGKDPLVHYNGLASGAVTRALYNLYTSEQRTYDLAEHDGIQIGTGGTFLFDSDYAMQNFFNSNAHLNNLIDPYVYTIGIGVMHLYHYGETDGKTSVILVLSIEHEQLQQGLIEIYGDDSEETEIEDTLDFVYNNLKKELKYYYGIEDEAEGRAFVNNFYYDRYLNLHIPHYERTGEIELSE